MTSPNEVGADSSEAIVSNRADAQADYLSQYHGLSTEVQKLSVYKNHLNNEQVNLEKQILKAKQWAVKQPMMQDFVEKLQQFLQQKNVVAFNQMLSAFVEDVLEKDKTIELELYTSHSLPALKIHAMNNGNPESIMDGSGGSLANIVSTGLRVIAAARSPNRKFLVLDEADCWIKPERIELFAKVIGEISLKLNMQIVMISHHSASYFKKYGRVIEISKKGSKIEANIVSDTPFDAEGKDYINRLRLQNFMSHEDTTIDFHPNITCIIGENDIGKSAIGAGFRAIVRGQSEDGFVQHGKDFSRAWLDFDNGWTEFWQRNKKTTQENKQKVFYELLYNGVSQAQEYNSFECPDFIAKKLNIKEIDSIDVHLAHQKEPTFLIDSKTRPQDKAKILSLGKESFIVQKIMEKIKDKGKFLKQDLKTQEAAYHSNSLILRELEGIEAMENKLNLIYNLVGTLGEHTEHLTSLQKAVEVITNYLDVRNIAHATPIKIEEYNLEETSNLNFQIEQIKLNQNLSKIEKINNLEITDEIVDTYKINNLIDSISLAQKLANIDKVEEIDTSVEINNTQGLDLVIKNIILNKELCSIGQIDTKEVAVESVQTAIESEAKLAKAIEELQRLKATKDALAVKQENAKHWFEQLEIEKNAIYKELGGACPCCGTEVDASQLFAGH